MPAMTRAHALAAGIATVLLAKNVALQVHVPASAATSGCTAVATSFPSGASEPTCFSFDLSSLPKGPFAIHDAYPMPYFVAPPCANLSKSDTNCTSFAPGDNGQPDDAGAPAYANAGGECYALGHAGKSTVTLIDPANASAGVAVTLAGGVGGRSVQYRFYCDATVPASAGPVNAVGGMMYGINWPTPLACAPNATSSCPAANIPEPTPDQLLFQEMELGALVCYNMATTMGGQGCHPHEVPSIETFTGVAPSDVDTDGWCRAIKSFGGKYATIVAKHVCGFAIWPTKAGLPDRGFTYTYGVPEGRDIVKAFAESCRSVGVSLGIYYSVVSNEYLNVAGGTVRPPSTLGKGQIIVSQEEYADIVVQQLTELWTNYGDLAEIWFDGGFAVPSLQDRLLSLLNSTQPHACIFNGCGLSPNAVAWIGTESGHAPYPVWNTQDGCPSGAGTPFGASYVPKEVDLTLQNSDTWFYHEGTGYRPLDEMVSIYHDSVGHGGNMLLNVAPPPNSTLPSAAVQRYAALGRFIRDCYGDGATAAPSALAATASPCVNCTTVTLTLPSPARMDRFIIKEELSGGQRVLQFSIDVDGATVFNGTAIGRTLIALLPRNATGAKVTLTVTSARAVPTIRLFAAPDPGSCVVPSSAQNCTFLEDTLYTGPVASSSPAPSASVCCARCRADPACAFFTWFKTTCSLITAQQGSQHVQGAVSGSP